MITQKLKLRVMMILISKLATGINNQVLQTGVFHSQHAHEIQELNH